MELNEELLSAILDYVEGVCIVDESSYKIVYANWLPHREPGLPAGGGEVCYKILMGREAVTEMEILNKVIQRYDQTKNELRYESTPRPHAPAFQPEPVHPGPEPGGGPPPRRGAVL